LLTNGKETFVGTRLSIKEARREDRGSYLCKADNNVGKSRERVQSLEVEYPPKIDVPKPRVPQANHYEAQLVTINIYILVLNWRK